MSSRDPRFSRRDFIATSAIVGGSLLADPGQAMAAPTATTASVAKLPLDIAEWSFFWVGVEHKDLGKGEVVLGKQMYVEYMVPAKVKHPYPIVLVHGGGGQGLDWMGTPDGRRGWFQHLLLEGYKVYVVDRPGHGRSPYHPDLQGPFGRVTTLEQISGLFTSAGAKAPNAPAHRKLHNQWPGTGEVGSKELSQLVSSQGGSYGNGPGTGTDPQTLVWQQRGAEMLDKIGPAIIMTHSAGGPFGLIVAEARPNLVKGLVIVEGAGGQAFGQQSRWGLINLPVAYDPPVKDPAEIKTKTAEPTAEDKALGIQPYRIQEEPARKIKSLLNTPVCVYTSEASFVLPNPGAVAYLKQGGVNAEEVRLKSLGIHGNGHLMMGERNNRECLQPILDWLDKTVNKGAPQAKAATKPAESTAMKLADHGYFWVHTEPKKVDYGTIVSGQMFVQYLIPEKVKAKYPIILVHGGGGEGTHYMGIGGGVAGWAHYYVQAGYKTYIVDRPGHGRSVFHPDALGPIGAHPNYATITGDFKRATAGPNNSHPRWLGTGDVGDPLIDQFQAGQNAALTDNNLAQRLWALGGAEILDKIGPAIIQVHSAGGPFGWLVANERPGMVKAIVNVEGGGNPFTPGTPWGITSVPLVYDPPVADAKEIATKDVAAVNGAPAYKLQAEPARKLKNITGIPITYVVAEQSGRNGVPVVEYLKQAGCSAEVLNLKDKGILGNGHFMMLETNRKEVFEVLNKWITEKVKA